MRHNHVQQRREFAGTSIEVRVHLWALSVCVLTGRTHQNQQQALEDDELGKAGILYTLQPTFDFAVQRQLLVVGGRPTQMGFAP